MKDFNRGFKRNFGTDERHPAVCTDCGKDCTVPFKPTEGKAVRCTECHRKFKGF